VGSVSLKLITLRQNGYIKVDIFNYEVERFFLKFYKLIYKQVKCFPGRIDSRQHISKQRYVDNMSLKFVMLRQNGSNKADIFSYEVERFFLNFYELIHKQVKCFPGRVDSRQVKCSNELVRFIQFF
jgi:hypothetical protein